MVVRVPRGVSRAVLLSALSVVLVAGLVVGGWALDRDGTSARPALTSALAVAPASTTVLGFTDWDRVRATGVDDADDRDLLTRSALNDLGEVVPQNLGWSTADVRWEAFVQDNRSGVLVVAPGPSLPWGRIEGGLRDAGFSDDGDGRWSADPAALVAAGLGDQFTSVGLVRSAGVLVAGADPGGVDAVVDVARGRAPALSSVRPFLDTAAALSGADTVLLQAGPLSCDATAMPDGEAQAQAAAAQERTGRLRPYAVAGRALADRGGTGDDAQTARYALTFDSVDTAREQARVREALSTGPFVGRTGQVEDDLRLQDVMVAQATLTLAFDHAPDGAVVMLGTGPLLFATC